MLLTQKDLTIRAVLPAAENQPIDEPSNEDLQTPQQGASRHRLLRILWGHVRNHPAEITTMVALWIKEGCYFALNVEAMTTLVGPDAGFALAIPIHLIATLAYSALERDVLIRAYHDLKKLWMGKKCRALSTAAASIFLGTAGSIPSLYFVYAYNSASSKLYWTLGVFPFLAATNSESWLAVLGARHATPSVAEASLAHHAHWDAVQEECKLAILSSRFCEVDSGQSQEDICSQLLDTVIEELKASSAPDSLTTTQNALYYISFFSLLAGFFGSFFVSGVGGFFFAKTFFFETAENQTLAMFQADNSTDSLEEISTETAIPNSIFSAMILFALITAFSENWLLKPALQESAQGAKKAIVNPRILYHENKKSKALAFMASLTVQPVIWEEARSACALSGSPAALTWVMSSFFSLFWLTILAFSAHELISAILETPTTPCNRDKRRKKSVLLTACKILFPQNKRPQEIYQEIRGLLGENKTRELLGQLYRRAGLPEEAEFLTWLSIEEEESVV